MHRILREGFFAGLILWGLASPAPAQAPVTPGTNSCVTKGVGCNFVPYGVTNPLAESPTVAGAAVSSANPLPTTAAAPASGTAGAGYPPGSTAVTSSATGTTGAVVATLPAVAAKFTYLCTMTVEGNEAATGAVVAVTVAGTVSGSLNYTINHPVTPALGILTITYTPCVQSSAVNTAISVTSAADAAGTNVAVTATGFQQ